MIRWCRRVVKHSYDQLQLQLLIPSSENHEEDQNMEGGFPLDELPVDIAVNILRRLTLAVRVRLTAVSKPWNQFLVVSCASATTATVREFPWLLLPKSLTCNEKGDTISFLSISDDMVIHDLKVPSRPPAISTTINTSSSSSSWCCCGSSRGWLLLFFHQPPVVHVNNLLLLDPLSGVILNLPDITTIIPYAQENIGCFSTDMIKSIEVSSNSVVVDHEISIANDEEDDSSAADPIVAVIFNSKNHKSGILAICRPKVAKKWTMFRPGSDLEENFVYSDILFHNGKLFVTLLSYHTEERLYYNNIIAGIGKRHSVTLNDGSTTEVQLELLDIHHHEDEANIPESEFISKFLVESIHGELLLVEKSVEVIEETSYIWSFLRRAWFLTGSVASFLLRGFYNQSEEYPLNIEIDHKTTNFRIYKLCRSGRGEDQEEILTSLDDQVLFLNYGSSAAMVAPAARNFKPNCIYFPLTLYTSSRQFDAERIGVFCLENRRIEFPIPDVHTPPGSCCWFSPQSNGLLPPSCRRPPLVRDKSPPPPPRFIGWLNTFEYTSLGWVNNLEYTSLLVYRNFMLLLLVFCVAYYMSVRSLTAGWLNTFLYTSLLVCRKLMLLFLILDASLLILCVAYYMSVPSLTAEN